MITEEVARKQLETLHQEGSALAKSFAEEKDAEPFEAAYQRWYSRALPLMKQLALDRYAEFQSYYITDPRYAWYDTGAFIIQDYFRDRNPDEDSVARQKVARSFTSQLALLKSVSDRLTWGQMDTTDQAERGLQLAFLGTARRLMDIDARSAGALAATVLETFFKKLTARHQLKFRKQAPPLREYIDALHTAKVLDIPVHAQATWAAEIADRSRSEGEAPTKLQVRDLIDGTHWLITNVF
jgi:hypothetical protein